MVLAMSFVEAFKVALAGHRIRRAGWHGGAQLTTDYTLRLVCVPEQRNWSGPFQVSLEDVEAEDWVVVP